MHLLYTIAGTHSIRFLYAVFFKMKLNKALNYSPVVTHLFSCGGLFAGECGMARCGDILAPPWL